MRRHHKQVADAGSRSGARDYLITLLRVGRAGMPGFSSVREVSIAFVAIAALEGSAGGQSVQERIYQPPERRLVVEGLPVGTETIRVVTSDGLTLTGLDVHGRKDRPILLIFHGNASAADETVRWFEPLARRGYNLVVCEYRGYSGNPGRPDERGLAQDAAAFLAHAKQIANGRRVIVVGHSLGGGVAFGLAAQEKLDALVTIGTFTRLRAMVPKLARFLVMDRYDNLAAVSALNEPWFLIHGSADDVVPASMANELHNAAVRSHLHGETFALTGAGHHPDGSLLAQVIDVAVAELEGRKPPNLPSSVKAYPFGG